jgi:hypothetical protein
MHEETNHKEMSPLRVNVQNYRSEIFKIIEAMKVKKEIDESFHTEKTSQINIMHILDYIQKQKKKIKAMFSVHIRTTGEFGWDEWIGCDISCDTVSINFLLLTAELHLRRTIPGLSGNSY